MKEQGLLNSTCEDLTPSIPERRLYLAVLERAVRDLESKSLLEVSDALAWFYATDKIKRRISFKDCLDVGGFTPSQLQVLKEKILEGKNRANQFKSERQKGGERNGQLVERERDFGLQKNRTV